MERGKQVLVGLNEKMVVGDHDFTKLTLTPSVNFLVNIPESMEETFYYGRVFAGLNPLTANDALPNYPSTAEAVNAVT